MCDMDFDEKFEEIDILIKEALFCEADEYEKIIENIDYSEPTEEEIQKSYKKLMLKIDERNQK